MSSDKDNLRMMFDIFKWPPRAEKESSSGFKWHRLIVPLKPLPWLQDPNGIVKKIDAIGTWITTTRQYDYTMPQQTVQVTCGCVMSPECAFPLLDVMEPRHST